MTRLDTALVALGMVSSRNKAQRLINEGVVFVDNEPVTKRSYEVHADSQIDIRTSQQQYVSRGAYKLLGALQSFMPLGFPNPQDKYCLDIGASTGGFTQVLLQYGAKQVVALDVGHGQLDPLIAHDPRVIELSGMNIRETTADDLPWKAELVVSDVSFISLRFVIAQLEQLCAEQAEAILLIKPQFEVGREWLDKHGIVTSDARRREVVTTIAQFATLHHWNVVNIIESPITGSYGNVEYLLWLRHTTIQSFAANMQ